MKIILNFNSIFCIIGFSLGIFLSIVFLNLTYKNKTTNIILSVLFFLLSATIASNVLIFTDLYLYIPHLIRFEWLFIFLFGPILIFYIRFLANDKTELTKFEIIILLIHFILIISMVPFYLKGAKFKIEYYQKILNGGYYYYDIIYLICVNIFQWIYIFLIYKFVNKHEKKIKEKYSSIEQIDLTWIKYSFIAFVIMIISIDIFIFLFFMGYYYKLIYILLPDLATLLLIFLGYKGLTQQEIFAKIKNTGNDVEEKKLESGKSKNFIKILIDYMEKEKPYTNPDLTLAELAKMLSVSSKDLTSTIYNNLNQNFYEFINNYRVNDVKDKIINPKYHSADLFSIAYETGFKSKNEFNNIFQSFTLMTPIQYKQKNIFTKKNRSVTKTIGIFNDNLYGSFETDLIMGIKKFTEENGINLICFTGGSINSPYYNYAQKNTVYELADKENIDGLLVISITLGTYIERKELEKFYLRFSPIPFISIGMNLEGIPSLVVDNKNGLRDLMKHLIIEHGYKKIAFICGPDGNLDAKVRLDTYKEVLMEYNIPINNDLIVPGTFLGSSGAEAINLLLDERKVKFDAIASANDYMAINAMYELQRRGIRVPEDIAVVGFDDAKEGRYQLTPLTTVSQPSFELGYLAANNLLLYIEGKKQVEKIELPSKLIIRRSCGCPLIQKEDLTKFRIEPRLKISKLKLAAIKESLIAEIELNMIDGFGTLTNSTQRIEWINRLLGSILESLKYMDKDIFLKVLENILTEAIFSRIEALSWFNILNYIFKKIVSYFPSKKKIDFIIALSNNAKELIVNIGIRLQEYPMVKNYEHGMKLFQITQGLLTVFEINKLKDIIINELPRLGIKSCYLSLFNNENYNNTKEYSSIIAAYKNFKEINFNKDQKIFASKKLIPGGIFDIGKGSIYIIMSLYFGEEQLGFIIYEIENFELSIYENLTLQLSSAVKGVMLFGQVQRQTEIIKIDTNKEIDNSKEDKYFKSKLSKEKSMEYFRTLIEYMEKKKPFIDPDLTLPDLAVKLNISRNNLSYIINEYSGLNFYDFINSYRLEEAKKYLLADEIKRLNILDIAYDAGFKSKSTFNKIFKKYTLLTPSEFRKEYLKNKKKLKDK